MVEFWRMLWETNCNTILMLSDKEDEVMYIDVVLGWVKGHVLECVCNIMNG